MAEATAKVSRMIAADPETIWAALTSPAKLKSFYFGSDVESGWKVGDPITFRGEFKGRAYEDKGEIMVAERPRRLRYSHYSPVTGEADSPENYHTVTFDLVPKTGGTEVTLTQANLLGGVKESDVRNRAEFEKNWHTLLEGLDRTVTNRS